MTTFAKVCYIGIAILVAFNVLMNILMMVRR